MSKDLLVSSLLLIGSALVFTGCTKATPAPVTTPVVSPAPAFASPSSEIDSFTMEEVAIHDSKADCQFVIDDNVYDLTSYIDQHPGGLVIAQGCGKDASKMFHAVGKHQEKAMNLLETFKIGQVKLK